VAASLERAAGPTAIVAPGERLFKLSATSPFAEKDTTPFQPIGPPPGCCLVHVALPHRLPLRQSSMPFSASHRRGSASKRLTGFRSSPARRSTTCAVPWSIP